MISLNEKQMVISSLAKQKNATENSKKISVTDDYTIEERLAIRIRSLKQEIRESEGEGNYIWRVRGSPKTGCA